MWAPSLDIFFSPRYIHGPARGAHISRCGARLNYFSVQMRSSHYQSAATWETLGATATTAALCTVVLHFFIVTRL
jgi:hypothetical protein